ncbi:hypothetical protein SDC9_117495 [bioreactor metagenome]|uniref:Uncharacterized protein n=1 Tax=bioreactor metagenome TaxID=1076179 RepID=A0A645BYF8_9ZZZZ
MNHIHCPTDHCLHFQRDRRQLFPLSLLQERGFPEARHAHDLLVPQPEARAASLLRFAVAKEFEPVVVLAIVPDGNLVP